MRVGDVMKRKVITIEGGAPVRQAIRSVTEHKIGLLPVVDQEGQLLGNLWLRDLLRLLMPSFIDILEDVDFVHDFGATEQPVLDQAVLESPVETLMEPPVVVEEDAGLMRALAVMRQHRVTDVPIVDQANRLVGLASWVDVCTALLRAASHA